MTTNDVTSTIQGQGALQIDNTMNTFTIADDPNVDVELSISTVIQGLDPTSGFYKYGAGTLALSGDNTFGGDTSIDGGTVIAESDTALGSDSGTVHVQGGASLWLEGDTLTIANPLNIAGDGVDIRGAIRNFATSATAQRRRHARRAWPGWAPPTARCSTSPAPSTARARTTCSPSTTTRPAR